MADAIERARDSAAKIVADRALLDDDQLLLRILAFAQQAPEGWKLVPVEATEEMIDAGDFVAVRHFVAAGRYNAEVWSAMLDASPSVGEGV